MYQIIRESIKVMEHLWEFYPCAFIIQKTVKTGKKTSTKKAQQKQAGLNHNLVIFNSKKTTFKRPSNLSLPKIYINNVDTNKIPKYVKSEKFLMPKNPFKSCKENPKHLENSIFSTKSYEKTSINCSTGQISSVEDIKSFKEITDKDASYFFKNFSTQSNSKSRVRSLKEIPDESALDQNSNKNINKSIASCKNFRISSKKPVVRSLVEFDMSRREKSRSIIKQIKF